MPAAAGGPGVGGVGTGAGHFAARLWRGRRRPPLDVDDLGQSPVAIDHKERPSAVTEPVDALEARQLGAIGERIGGRGPLRPLGVVVRAQEQRAGRDPPVLIG